MTTIELTDGQRQILQAEPGKPLDVVDPATKQRYVLLAQEQYDRVRSLLEQAPVDPGVPPGILQSQQAFWRDLPELLKHDQNRGKWVCYHGDERIGIADTKRELVRECLRRQLRDDEYDFDVIEPRKLPPWEPDDVDFGGNEVADVAVLAGSPRSGHPS
jgi:hypothetical protein